MKELLIMPIPKDTEEYLGGHSVLVGGYIDGKNPTKSLTGCLIIRNSWGIEWGDKGYFYMPYEYVKENTFDYWVMNKQIYNNKKIIHLKPNGLFF